MLKTGKRKFVYMECRENEQGFTFISLLAAVSILFLIIPLILFTVKTAANTSYQQEISTQQFFSFLQDDFLQAVSVEIKPQKIEYRTIDDTVITMEQRNNLIIRKVDGLGYEIYLRNLKDILFTPVPWGFTVSITTDEGDIYEKQVIFFQK